MNDNHENVLRRQMESRYPRDVLAVDNGTITLIAHPPLPNINGMLELVFTTKRGNTQSIAILTQEQADALIRPLACFAEKGTV
jgi:hypothetical protein